MFDALSERLSGVFRSLRGRGRISESNVQEAMQQVRAALLEADVHVEVARQFCDACLATALGGLHAGVVRRRLSHRQSVTAVCAVIDSRSRRVVGRRLIGTING